METTLISRHEKCLSVVHKNGNTVFALLRSPNTQSPNELKIVELDITTQTVCSSTVCLVFEGVQPHDSNFALLYSSGFLVLIYPTQMLCIYQDNEYFAARVDDQAGCKGLDFFDQNLTSSDNSSRIALKHVIQSQLKIDTPLLIETDLVFITKKAVDGQEASYLVSIPLRTIDILGLPNKQAIFTQLSSKVASDKDIYFKKSPLVDSKSKATDMVQVASHSFAVAFSCGTLWIVNARGHEQETSLLGLAYVQKFAGQEVKASCINTIDHILIRWKQTQSLHPDSFDAGAEDGPRVTEFMAMGDTLGNLLLFKNREPVFLDQVTYNQVAAVKFLNVSLTFAMMSTDGVLRICRFCPLPRKAADSNNLYEVVKLASVQSFQELNSQLKLNQISLRGSQILQIRSQALQLESNLDSLQILWPNRVLMKVKGNKAEDKFSAECQLLLYRIFESYHPMVKRSVTPIVLSNVIPSRFKDFIVQPDAESNGASEMTCERYCFLIDQIKDGDQAKPQVWISVYDYAKDTKTKLVNVTAESGVHDMDHFSVVRLDMRPEGPLSIAGVAKFLVTLELNNGQAGVSGLCCSFAVDMQTGQLAQNVLQLSGRTGIFLGKLDYRNPSILVLQEELKSLIIFSFDEGDLESKLPHGEVRLSSKVNGVYWTPMRDGLAVVYELQQENLLTFSKNRLSRYSVKDFGILVSRNIGLKLHYEERIFDIKWTGFSIGFASDDNQAIKGVVGTSQHIYFVDDNLHALGVTKWTQSPITSLQWLGDHTVMATTRNHLLQVYGERHPKTQVVLSLTQTLESDREGSSAELPVVVKVLADRVVMAARKYSGEVKFFSKPMLMLEPILLGYLKSTHVGKVDVRSVQNCLKYLDTVAISQKLIEALSLHGMLKSVKFMLKNQPMLTSKVGLQPHQTLKIDDFDDFLQTLFPKRDLSDKDQDLVQIRKKLSLDPVSLHQKKLLQKRAQACLKKGQLLDAFVCGDLLSDVDLQVQVMKQAKLDDAVVRDFLTVASQTKPYMTVKFDYQSVLRNKRSVNKVLRRVPESNIQKLMLAFDEVPLSYTCPDGPEGSEQTIPAAPVPFNAENFSTFIGVTKYIDPVLGQNNDNHDEDNKNEMDDQSREIADQDAFSDSDGPDEVDEKRHLKAYWRAEEGHGHQVADITDSAMHLQSDQLEWQTEPNPDGDPLEYQDKWGKANTANYAIAAPSTGLSIVKKKKQTLGSQTGCFTLEMWLRQEGDDEHLVLSVLSQIDNLSLFLNREDGRLICQLYNLKSKDSPVTRELPKSVRIGAWTHLAVKQRKDQLTVLLNFEQVAQFQGKSFQVGDASSQFSLMQAISASLSVLVTELRLWSIPLSSRLLRSMAKQPLAILFEQKRNLKVQINKNKKKLQASELIASGAEEQKAVAPKKKGGLKFTSKFDKNKVEAKPAQDTLTQDPSQIVPKEPSPKVVQEQSKFAFDGFDMAPTSQQPVVNSLANDMFNFGDVPQASEPVQENAQPVVDSQTDFFSFDQFSAAPPKNETPIDFNGFNDFARQPGSPVALQKESQEEPIEVAQSFDAFNFGASAKPLTPEKQEETKSALDSSQLAESVNMIDTSFQSETSSQSRLRLGDLLTSSRKQSRQSPVIEPEIPQDESEPSKPQQSVSPERIYSDLIAGVERAIGDANMHEASTQLQTALDLQISEAKKVASNEEKLAVKNRIRQCIVLKFTCNLATRISEVKEKVKTASNAYQKTNMQSQLASMANVLILLKLPDALRINFFRFALRQNLNVENYSALTKICSFWRKYSTTPEGAQFTTEKDKQKLTETESLCRNRQNRNVQQYHGDDCPECGANLAFGLATPQCHKCKAKIAICYKTLKPISKDKQTLKCHVCLAQFSLLHTQVNTNCPYCSLVKLKLGSAT